MIELRTGIPGSGKTLSCVQALARLVARWDKHPEEVRPIFVHGIKDLALPHAPVPLKHYRTRTDAMLFVPDWELMPDGALVIIDEAQALFPPRSSQSQVPEYVAWLNTHRHRGFDIWILTQHPKLIDMSVRALVGKHQHYRRLFGGQRAVVYEFDGCNDSLSQLGTAIISYWSYPKNVFDWYKSAEVHTKQSFKLPKWLLIPALGVLMGIIFVPRAYSVLTSGMAGKGVALEREAKAPEPDKPHLKPQPSVSAARVEPVTPFNRPVILASACLASYKVCKCYTSDGVHVPLPDALCRKAANEAVNFAEYAL